MITVKYKSKGEVLTVTGVFADLSDGFFLMMSDDNNGPSDIMIGPGYFEIPWGNIIDIDGAEGDKSNIANAKPSQKTVIPLPPEYESEEHGR